VASLINHTPIFTIVTPPGQLADFGNAGIATEVYYNVPTNYGLNIEVGIPGTYSAISFIPRHLVSNDRNTVKARQPPIYPTKSYSGLPGNINGLITHGDPTVNIDGFLYNGIKYGSGKKQGKNPTGGLVLLLIENI
jgi:hypothetical protein